MALTTQPGATIPPHTNKKPNIPPAAATMDSNRHPRAVASKRFSMIDRGLNDSVVVGIGQV